MDFLTRVELPLYAFSQEIVEQVCRICETRNSIYGRIRRFANQMPVFGIEKPIDSVKELGLSFYPLFRGFVHLGAIYDGQVLSE